MDNIQCWVFESVESILSPHSHNLSCYQSNHEGDLVDRIQLASQQAVDFIILNPAAYTHTSVAMRDALLAVSIPFIEVHLSNPLDREPFRHKSFFSDIAIKVISGHGSDSYNLAAEASIEYFNQHNK